jgi:hopanoid biosynthesis associated protein HpnK
VKRLIVNADDFGMTSGVNRAILESHRDGLVTSATLMATGAAFDEAVLLAREHTGLKVGCHVSLVQSMLMLSPERIPTLGKSSAGGSASRYHGLADLALADALGRLKPEEIAQEARAQFQKLQAAQIQISHFDTHKHVHLLPAVLSPLLEAARECGIRALRCPFEPPSSIPLYEFPARRRLWKRLPAVRVLRVLQPAFRRMVAQHGLVTPDGAIGISATGCLDERLLESMLQCLPEGTWELVCHPAYIDEQLRSLSTLRTGEIERQALTSARIRRCLDACGIELIQFAHLLPEAHRLALP